MYEYCICIYVYSRYILSGDGMRALAVRVRELFAGVEWGRRGGRGVRLRVRTRVARPPLRRARASLRLQALQQPRRLLREGRGLSMPVQPLLERKKVLSTLQIHLSWLLNLNKLFGKVFYRKQKKKLFRYWLF